MARCYGSLGFPVPDSSPRRRFFLLLLTMLLLPAGCERPPSVALDQQVYIWQRQWRPAHEPALANSHADFTTLRVLAAQAHPREGWIQARVDHDLLRRDGRPVIAVIRLDDQLPTLDTPLVRQQTQALLNAWQRSGVNLIGAEIDHDCASARLPAYTAFLHQLRQGLPKTLALSITALPAWLDSPALPALLNEVDSSVLQVHAVSRPQAGLFSPRQALQWATAYGDKTSKPFYLALPAYGVALLANPDGGAPWVESEVSLPRPGTRRELMAEPEQVVSLLNDLKRQPPDHLQGLLWFRLPLPGDRRAWPLPTLQAVIHGQPLHSDIQLSLEQQGPLAELRLTNHGNRSAALPRQLQVAAQGCEAGDAIGGYRLQQPLGNPATYTLQSNDARPLLTAGQQLAVGWLRCAQFDQGGSRVTP